MSSQAHYYPEHPQAKYASVEAFPVLNENAEQSLLRLGGLLNAMRGIKVIKQDKYYLFAASSTFAAIFALIFASISFAISGLSCKIVFTESLP